MKAQSSQSESDKRQAELLEAELIKLTAEGKLRLGGGPIDEAYWKLKLPRFNVDAILPPAVIALKYFS